ncbi:hypothetical protein TIFTF001_033866 [Ficus carica]|uniref:Uncharacterized protein n=1 Tax=Ficus carica TaxID=3494 RepID=A0AA88E1J7_FICCA|nr:hypothetical protein TIFTF001_033866 [Ficus carica]
MLEIHRDLIISYRKLSLSITLPLHNSDPLAVMAHRLIWINAPSYNIADVSSYVHILEKPFRNLLSRSPMPRYHARASPIRALKFVQFRSWGFLLQAMERPMVISARGKPLHYLATVLAKLVISGWTLSASSPTFSRNNSHYFSHVKHFT